MSRAWLDHFVKGDDNGVDQEPRVQIATDPWSGKRAAFPTLPPTRTLSFALLGGPKRVGWSGKVVRAAGKTTMKIENFGSPVVVVRAPTTAGWDRLVAVLTATTPTGKQIVVSAGGARVKLGTRPKQVRIRLISQLTGVPKGSRLRLTVAATSTAQSPGNLLYLSSIPRSSRLVVGPARMTVPLLAKPVSR